MTVDKSNQREPLAHFGPMYGEATRRHQWVSNGSLDEPIVVSIYEHNGQGELRLGIELTGRGSRADLTTEEVGWLFDACAEYLSAHGDPS
jgi:hypothetical protein